ncbi:STM4014 family protein [Paenibacillus konkukensis]|nr:STM4014 family protein [Paenibacillus konkukensis]
MERMILIGNPGNRRTSGLQAARLKMGLPPALELSYLELLEGEASLARAAERAGYAGISEPPLLRLDAPGELFEVERALIALGAPDACSAEEADRLLPYGGEDWRPLSRNNALRMQERHGRLYHPSQWFRGYCRLLAGLEQEARRLWAAPRWVNAPGDIAVMFDKRATHRLLTDAGIPMPRLLASPEELPDYEALREKMAAKRMHRIFLKLATGSGACGVIAYQTHPATGAEVAVTTMGMEHYTARPPSIFSVKKPYRYTDAKVIKPLVDWLLKHGAHAEQWIPKASYKERTFDIRQLVVRGEACHQVARVSGTPITNLHIRNERMTAEEVGLSEADRRAARECAESALAAFPASSVAGIDIALSNGARRPYVLDVNPFGDLLYRVQYRGYDPYEWQYKKI